MSHLTTQLVANKINPEDNNKTTFSTDKRFKSFMPIFHCNVESLVKSIPSKSCELDPIPTKLLKTNISILAYPVACIINKSLQDGIVCDEMKEALLHPFLRHIWTLKSSPASVWCLTYCTSLNWWNELYVITS